MSDPEGLSRHPTGYFASFLAATAFCTRVPVDQRGAVVWRLADSAWAFPLVGAGIGGAAALALLLAQLIGLGNWPAAMVSILAGLVLTGALHEDGLADTADGFFGGRDRGEAGRNEGIPGEAQARVPERVITRTIPLPLGGR